MVRSGVADDDFPTWVVLKHRLVGSNLPLEDRILAEWQGSCPFCSRADCIIGFAPIQKACQRSVPLEVGDAVVQARSSRRAEDLVLLVVSVAADAVVAQPVLPGGNLLHRSLGEPVELRRRRVSLAASYVLHPAPPCPAFQEKTTEQLIAEVKRQLLS